MLGSSVNNINNRYYLAHAASIVFLLFLSAVVCHAGKVELTMDSDGEGYQGLSPVRGNHFVYADTAQLISATALSGYHFVRWTIDGGGRIENPYESSTTVTLTDNATVTAFFKANTSQAELTTVVLPTNGGQATPEAGSHLVYINEPVIIKAEAAEGYFFKNWSIDGNGTIENNDIPETRVVLTANSTVTANFTRGSAVGTAILTLTDSPNGSTTPDTDVFLLFIGEKMEITATADAGYHFTEWATTGTAQFDNKYMSTTYVSLTENSTIAANFAIDTGGATMTLAVGTSGSGALNPGNGTYTVKKGEPQVISAQPADGYEFSGWTVSSDDAVTISSTTAMTTSVIITDNATITADFSKKKVILDVAVYPTGAGTTDPEAGETGEVEIGTEESISATAEEGYVFVSWTVDGDATIEEPGNSSTKAVINGNATITANFAGTDEKASVTVLTIPQTGGMAKIGTSTSTDTSIEETTNHKTTTIGSDVSISATPSEGYSFVKWATQDDTVTIKDAEKDSTSVVLTGTGVVTAVFSESTANAYLKTGVTPSGVGYATPLGTQTVIVGTSLEIQAFLVDSAYTFMYWDVIGNATVADKLSAKTTVRVDGNATVKAVFGKSSDICVLTQGVIAGAGVIDRQGQTYVLKDEPVSIRAIPYAGYVFSGWASSGNLFVKNSYGSLTEATLSGNSYIYASFEESTPEKTDQVLQIQIKISSQKVNRDSASIHNAPSQLRYFDPDKDTALVLIDGNVFTIDSSEGRFTAIPEGFLFTSSSGVFSCTLNVIKETWNFTAKNANLSLLDNSDGVDIILMVNSEVFGRNYMLQEKSNWSFSSRKNIFSTIRTSGSAMSKFKVSRVQGKQQNVTSNLDTLTITGEASPSGYFDPRTETLSLKIDNLTCIVPPNQLVQKSVDNYVYTDKTRGITFKVDFRKEKWLMILKKNNIWGKITFNDGIDVILSAGEYESGVNLKAVRRTTLKYTNKEEIANNLSGDSTDTTGGTTTSSRVR